VVKWLVIGIVPDYGLLLVFFRYFQNNSLINLDKWLPHIIGLVLMIVTAIAALQLQQTLSPISTHNRGEEPEEKVVMIYEHRNNPRESCQVRLARIQKSNFNKKSFLLC
jgi:hypothetical protein